MGELTVTKDGKELLAKMQEMFDKQNKHEPCRECGHCPTCGRRDAPQWVGPYWYPNYVWPNTWTITSTAGTGGTHNLHGNVGVSSDNVLFDGGTTIS